VKETRIDTIQSPTGGTLRQVSSDGILLAFCNAYATMLSTDVLPGFTARLLGRTGFAALTQLFRELSRRYVREVRRFCCQDATPEEVLEETARVNLAEGKPRFALMPVRVSRGPGRLDLMFRVGRRCDELCMAPFLGLVAGVFEEAGYRVATVSSRQRVRALQGRVDYVAYPLVVGDDYFVIRVEKL